MAILNWTYEAERWLREIHTYIAIDSPKSANQVIAGIYKKAQLLKDFPEIGYQYRTEPEGDIRILLYGHYRIAYLIRLLLKLKRLSKRLTAKKVKRLFYKIMRR